jgi:hypothetical protein
LLLQQEDFGSATGSALLLQQEAFGSALLLQQEAFGSAMLLQQEDFGSVTGSALLLQQEAFDSATGSALLLQQEAFDSATGSALLLQQEEAALLFEGFDSGSVLSESLPTNNPATIPLLTAAIGRITAMNGPSNA